MAKTKIAILDFCGTMINFQSADRFVEYIVAHEDSLQKRSNRIDFRIKVYNKLRLFNFFKSLHKSMICKKVKGVNLDLAKKYARQYLDEIIEPNKISESVGLIDTWKKEGCYLLFVSAAYGIYLDLFAKRYNVDFVISGDIGVRNNKLTGKVVHDCIGRTKKDKAIAYLDKKFGVDGYEIVYSIGDSKSDIPVLEIAKNPIVVSSGNTKWNDKYKEIRINE